MVRHKEEKNECQIQRERGRQCDRIVILRVNSKTRNKPRAKVRYAQINKSRLCF